MRAAPLLSLSLLGLAAALAGCPGRCGQKAGASEDAGAPLPDAGPPPAPPPSAEPAPAGDLRDDVATYQLVIFPVAGKAPEDLVAFVRPRAARAFPALRLLRPGELLSALPAAVVGPFESPGVPEEVLKEAGKGLTAGERAALAKPRRAIVLELHVPGDQALPSLKAAQALALALAKELPGDILDVETGDYWSAEAWAEERAGGWSGDLPQAPVQLVIRQAPLEGGQSFRSVTAGMARFGLPDLVIRSHPGGTTARGLGSVINLTCQMLIERPSLAVEGQLVLDASALQEPRLRDALREFTREGGSGQAKVALLQAAPEPGDPDNRLMEIAFPGMGSVEDRQVELLGRLFGAAPRQP
jgi:hypothetical protein